MLLYKLIKDKSIKVVNIVEPRVHSVFFYKKFKITFA